MAVEERPNMPATTIEWPNWCIALPQPIELLETNATAVRVARILSKGRPRNSSLGGARGHRRTPANITAETPRRGGHRGG
jgi:hypothetical protein